MDFINCPSCEADMPVKEVECFYFVKVITECKKCNNYFWGYGMDYSEAVEDALEGIKEFTKIIRPKKRSNKKNDRSTTHR